MQLVMAVGCSMISFSMKCLYPLHAAIIMMTMLITMMMMTVAAATSRPIMMLMMTTATHPFSMASSDISSLTSSGSRTAGAATSREDTMYPLRVMTTISFSRRYSTDLVCSCTHTPHHTTRTPVPVQQNHGEDDASASWRAEGRAKAGLMPTTPTHDDGGGVGGKEVLALPHADDERGAPPRADQQVGLVLEREDEAERAVDGLQRRADDGVQRHVGVLRPDTGNEVGEDLRVRLGDELVPAKHWQNTARQQHHRWWGRSCLAASCRPAAQTLPFTVAGTGKAQARTPPPSVPPAGRRCFRRCRCG